MAGWNSPKMLDEKDLWTVQRFSAQITTNILRQRSKKRSTWTCLKYCVPIVFTRPFPPKVHRQGKHLGLVYRLIIYRLSFWWKNMHKRHEPICSLGYGLRHLCVSFCHISTPMIVWYWYEMLCNSLAWSPKLPFSSHPQCAVATGSANWPPPIRGFLKLSHGHPWQLDDFRGTPWVKLHISNTVIYLLNLLISPIQ